MAPKKDNITPINDDNKSKLIHTAVLSFCQPNLYPDRPLLTWF